MRQSAISNLTYVVALTCLLGCDAEARPTNNTTGEATGSDAGSARDGAAMTAAQPMDAGVDASHAPGASADAALARPDGAVSQPGQYSGFGERIYKGYALTSAYVPVRDGTKLAVDFYRPKNADGSVVSTPLPVIWMHTPYNRRTFTAGTTSGLSGETYPGAAARLIEYGYVVAIADFRGVYASYGTNAGYNRGEWVDAARLDAYDITEWLAVQPWSSGKIGMWGCSATGGSQLQAATTAPPHLKAVFPMSCEFDAYPFGVPGGVSPASGTTKAPPGGPVGAAQRDPAAQPVDDDMDKTQLQAAVKEHAAGIENPGFVPFRDSVSPAIPATWWVKTSPHTYLDAINQSGIAIYVAANWDEAATKYGAFFTLNNVTTPAKLVVGPSTHCAWFTVQKDTGFDIAVEERRFFDYWLKGIDNGVMQEPKVYYYTYNEPKGQEWRSAVAWPLPEEKRRPYYLAAKALAATAPSEAAAQDQIAVDYDLTDATLASKGLSYETPPLAADTRVTGHPEVLLWVSSTASDGDFVATLQDVAPDGTTTSYNMNGRLRASLRKEADAPYHNLGLPWHPFGSTDAEALAAGTPVPLHFDLLPMSLVFKAGHRIRLVLTFADPAASPRVQPAPTVTVYRDAAHPSSVTLPIIEN